MALSDMSILHEIILFVIFTESSETDSPPIISKTSETKSGNNYFEMIFTFLIMSLNIIGLGSWHDND